MRFIRTAVRAAKLLFFVRAALPRWMQVMLGVALVCTCMPGVPDFGLDEAIYVVAGAVLWFRHRTLVRALWHEAGNDLQSSGVIISREGWRSPPEKVGIMAVVKAANRNEIVGRSLSGCTIVACAPHPAQSGVLYVLGVSHDGSVYSVFPATLGPDDNLVGYAGRNFEVGNFARESASSLQVAMKYFAEVTAA